MGYYYPFQEPIDAKRNWWGHHTGPSGDVEDGCTSGIYANGSGDLIYYSGEICFYPYCINEACTGYSDDVDGDGILDDGDGSGTPGDNPCRGGNATDCDDNCVNLANASQADTDNDTIGDACDCDQTPDPEPEITVDPFVLDTEDYLSDNESMPSILTDTDLIAWVFEDEQPYCCPDNGTVQAECGYKYPDDPDNATTWYSGGYYWIWAWCTPGDVITDNETREMSVRSTDCTGQYDTVGDRFIRIE